MTTATERSQLSERAVAAGWHCRPTDRTDYYSRTPVRIHVIWQGDANRIAIECLARAATPPFVLNLTGHERLSVRALAEWFGARFGTTPRLVGSEGPDALLSNTDRMRSLFAKPEVSLDHMLEMVADWVDEGGALLGKPTKFEARDGRF